MKTLENIVHGSAVVIAINFTDKSGSQIRGWALPGRMITTDVGVAQSTARRMYELIQMHKE